MKYRDEFEAAMCAKTLEEAKEHISRLYSYNQQIKSKVMLADIKTNYLKSQIYSVIGLPGGLEHAKKMLSTLESITEQLDSCMKIAEEED